MKNKKDTVLSERGCADLWNCGKCVCMRCGQEARGRVKRERIE